MDEPRDQPESNQDLPGATAISDDSSNQPSPGALSGTAVVTVWYHTDYLNALKNYLVNPSERRQGRSWIFLFLFASVFGVIVLGMNGGLTRPLQLRGIVCWEIIAIVNTCLFGLMYFRDLYREAKDSTRLRTGQSTLVVVLLWAVNLLFLVVALGLLVYSEHEMAKNPSTPTGVGFWLYVTHLLLLIMSFVIFTRLDYVFARDSKVFRKTREYWAYCLFIDAPATVAFLVLILYLLLIYSFGPPLNLDVISGAIAMQMLITDTLYLVIASNFHLWLLANRLSAGCDQ